MLKSIKNLFVDELHDILSAEKQIAMAMPRMVAAAQCPELKKAFAAHLKESKAQIERLNKVLKYLKVKKQTRVCHAAKGIIQECKGVLQEYKAKCPIRDVALISKMQRFEHYEMAAYGTLCAFAQEIGLDAAAKLLHESLEEERNADKALSKIAQGTMLHTGVNRQANLPSEPKKKKKAASHHKKARPHKAAKRTKKAKRASR